MSRLIICNNATAGITRSYGNCYLHSIVKEGAVKSFPRFSRLLDYRMYKNNELIARRFTANAFNKSIRNVAIVAHVDHGKTSIVNQLLSHNKTKSSSMDNEDLEKERGITIISKITRFKYFNGKEEGIINMVDTPGHVDFSGEVDRVLSMVDGVCLVVDINEGVLSQTKYVLGKAIESNPNLRVILLLNKCDNEYGWETRGLSGTVETQVLDLFDKLGANAEQMEYVTLYASAKEGWCTDDADIASQLVFEKKTKDLAQNSSMQVLMDMIWKSLPPSGIDTQEKFSYIVNNVGNDQYLGRTCTGKIHSGSVSIQDSVSILSPPSSSPVINSSSTPQLSSVTGIFVHEGISRVELSPPKAYAGDIATLTGVPPSIRVGDTLTHSANPVSEPIPSQPLPPSILSMEIGANNGPLLGKDDSEHNTSQKIWDRLLFETDNNVSLSLERCPHDNEKSIIYCRGTLQLGILFEQMRRESYELTVSSPLILTTKKDGITYEPYEEVIIDTPNEYQGVIMDNLTTRGALFQDMQLSDRDDDQCRLIFELSSRSLIGLSMELATLTKGSSIVNHAFLENRPSEKLSGNQQRKKRGKLTSNDHGKATLYALSTILQRGILFISPGDSVYPGMVIGERTDGQKQQDLEVNPIKAKKVTNMRATGKDEKSYLPPKKTFSIEEIVSYMDPDEIVEITPKNIRLRKKELNPTIRAKMAKQLKRKNKA